MGAMTATDELRRMLDERGVEWHDTKIGKGFITVFEHDGITWVVTEHSSGRLSVKGCVKPTQGHYDGMTPEQAIAATLGRGECRNASKVMDEHGQARFACSECHAWIDSRLLWNPEYRNGESPWVSGCKLNFCPNCGRRIVEPTTNDVDAEVDA